MNVKFLCKNFEEDGDDNTEVDLRSYPVRIGGKISH